MTELDVTLAALREYIDKIVVASNHSDRAYLVSYDVSDGRRIAALTALLKQSPGGWWNYLKWTWIVVTQETAHQVTERLRPALAINDRLLVVELHADTSRQGWLPDEAWTWLRSQLGN